MIGAGSVCVVLGAGGARGFAHLGVLERLRAQGIGIDAIIGCSVGGLVGAFYAARGASIEQMHRIGRSMSGRALLSHAWSGWTGRRQRSPAGLAGTILAPLAGASFSRLHHGVRFLGITAFDLIRRRDILFCGSGEHGAVTVSEAAIGGAAIPVLFPPKRVRHGDRRYRLIDAGFVDSVPVGAALQLPFPAATIIAVDLSVRIGIRQARSDYWPGLRHRLGDRLIRLRPRVKRFGTVLFLRRDVAAMVDAGRESITSEVLGALLDNEIPNH